MAEFTDDCGSDAEMYEDALEELQTEEDELVAKTKAVRLTEPKGENSNKDTVVGENETVSSGVEITQTNVQHSNYQETNSDCADSGEKSDSMCDQNAVDAQAKHTDKSDKDDDSRSESASESEQEEQEEEANEKPYCDIPAADEENDHDALHDRLNQQMDEDEEEEDKEEKVEDIYFVDEEAMKKLEENMTDEEKEAKKNEAQEMKAQGNEQFKASELVAAMDTYTQALRICPLCYAKERAIMYSNRAACQYRRELYDSCAKDCTKALELHPHYLKARVRRAQSYEQADKLEEALEDYTKVIEQDPAHFQAREACMRLPDQIKEKNEKLKEEMMGKLKELGNMVLKPFGLSTANFNLVQNPETGGYSVNFNNNGN